MNHAHNTILTLLLLLFVTGANAQDRPFGLGVMIGEPTGLSAKLWVSKTTAFDFGLGWSFGGDRIGRFDGAYDGTSRIHFHMDYLWHWFNAIHSAERFPLYTGIGGRINTGGGYKSSAAARGVFGVLWLPRGTPVDLFLEIVPSFQVVPATDFGLGAGVGARFFF